MERYFNTQIDILVWIIIYWCFVMHFAPLTRNFRIKTWIVSTLAKVSKYYSFPSSLHQNDVMDVMNRRKVAYRVDFVILWHIAKFHFHIRSPCNFPGNSYFGLPPLGTTDVQNLAFVWLTWANIFNLQKLNIKCRV